MRQAITTKYIGPTNNQGARVKASCQAGSLTVRWIHNLNERQNHLRAAKALADKLEWDGEWVGGFAKDGKGVFVQPDEDNTFIVERQQHVA